MNGWIVAHGVLSSALHEWTWEPVTIVVLVVLAALYWRGLRALRSRAGSSRAGVGAGAWAFGAGLLSVALALLSPLAWLSEVLFSAHMTQHEILMLISAPLLVFGRPLFVFLWAVDARRRTRLGGWTRRRGVSRVWHAFSSPVSAFTLHALALWIWHIPVLYEAALAHQGIHALQHAVFLLTACLFWWGMVHGRYGRIGYGAGVLYVFLTAVHSSILGALMTLAPSVWYGTYTRTAAAWQVDALADQQIAGLLMWVPSGLLFIVLGLALMAAWLGESDRRARLGSAAGPDV